MIEVAVLKEKLQRSFGLFDDLVQELKEENLKLDLAGLPSNTIGQQLWCVVGARHSYLRAILAGAWQGFSCSLDAKSIENKISVQEQLSASHKTFISAIAGLSSLTPGQLIRYLYGQKLPVPATWKKRYNLN